MIATPTTQSPNSQFENRLEEPRDLRALKPAGPTWADAAIVLAGYALLLLVTRTLDQGDSNVYADDLVGWLHGRPEATRWEFGHAYWRPLTFALFRTLHGGETGATDGVLFSEAIRMLTRIVMATGALAVVMFHSWLARLGVSRTAAVAASLTFAAAASFMGYSQTASAYVPALAMLVVALRELAADEERRDTRTIAAVSLAFACAVLLWFPMVLGVPAAAISMLLLRGDTARRRRIAIAVCLISGTITVVAYVPIAYMAGVRSVGELRAWAGASSHGIMGTGGVPRAIVGFARSLVNMDRLGLVAKRHLLGDSYNPASWGDVARAGLIRLGVLYALLGAMALWLLRRATGRRALALVLATAIPVVGFALKWQGGDLERYLALFPALFLAVSVALGMLPVRAQIASGVALVILVVAVNVPAISRRKSQQECEQLTARIGSVPRNDGRTAALWTPHDLDEIATYKGRCPHSPLLLAANPPGVFGLVMANQEYSAAWRDSIAVRSERLWAKGGHLWMSRRAFVERPLSSWKWAEGDDPRLHWRDFPAYFKQLDVGPPVGGEDGFVEVLPTPRTREAMARMRRAPPS